MELFRNEFINNDYPHVVILHDKLARKKSDRYMLNLALGYDNIGYKVTIITSNYERDFSMSDIRFSDKIRIEYSGWWIPRSIYGLISLSHFRAFWIVCRLLILPPKPKPEAVILDLSLFTLYFLKRFSKYKIFYVYDFEDIKNSDDCFEHTKLTPSLMEAKWLKMADHIIVESVGFAEIISKLPFSVRNKPNILYPSMDLGLWKEPVIQLQRIIPDLMDDSIIFLTIGRFKRSSNFILALDAFELLLELIEDKTVTERFHLVIAGSCKTLQEKMHYRELISISKQRKCGSQISLLKHLPILHEKTLIMESAVIIHPAKNDIYSEFVLKAMSLGKPIIAITKGIASKLLIHRLSAVIVDPEPKVIALALKKLMVNPHLQVFLGDLARDTFHKSYSFKAFCEELNCIMKKTARDSSEDMQNDETSSPI